VKKDHNSPISYIALSNEFIVTASYDGKLMIWSVKFGLLEHTIKIPFCDSNYSEENSSRSSS
jgi:hypothetical protein